MPEPVEQTFVSVLPVPAEVLWRQVMSFSGINGELYPWLRMTTPHGVATLDPEQIVLGERLFRSWLLLGGILPVEYDDLVIVELEPGRRFLERSSMLTSRVWEHERTVEALDDGDSRITDRVAFVPRWPWLAAVMQSVVGSVFQHRHRRLRRRVARRAVQRR